MKEHLRIQVSKKGNLPSADDPRYNRFFNCLAYVMEDQLRDLCLRSMKDYIDYLTDVGVSIHFFIDLLRHSQLKLGSCKCFQYFDGFIECIEYNYCSNSTQILALT